MRMPFVCMFAPVLSVRAELRLAQILVLMILVIISAIATWLLGIKMRKRIRRAIGRDVESESELTSLNTWMKVEDAENLASHDASMKRDQT